MCQSTQQSKRRPVRLGVRVLQDKLTCNRSATTDFGLNCVAGRCGETDAPVEASLGSDMIDPSNERRYLDEVPLTGGEPRW